MKKTLKNQLFFAAVLMLSLFLFNACGSNKKTATNYPSDEKVITVYCSGPDYQTDNKHFRANSEGESLDAATSKQKALLNARAELAAQMKAIISGMTDNYVNSMELNNVEAVEEKFEGFTRQIIDQELQGSHTICETRTAKRKGKYKTYVAIELSGDDIFNSMQQQLSEDAKTKIDYDYEKFRNSYEQALKEYREKNK